MIKKKKISSFSFVLINNNQFTLLNCLDGSRKIHIIVGQDLGKR